MLSIEFDTSFFTDLLQYVKHSEDISCRDLCEKFVEIYDNEKKAHPSIADPVNRTCIEIIRDVVNEDVDLKDDTQLASLELKIKDSSAAKKNPNKFSALLTILLGPKPQPKKMVFLEKKISDKLKWYNSHIGIKKQLIAVQKFSTSTKEAARSLALAEIEKGANEVLRALEHDIKKSQFMEYINFNDLAHIERALELNSVRKVESVFKTGLQGVNRILGDVGGFNCGCLCLIIALSGHHKTGTLMNLARWICTLNRPWPNRTGIPSVVFFSLENNINSNAGKWYFDAYCNMFGAYPENKSYLEMAKIVYEEFNKNGFHLHVFRESPGQFTINDYRNRINTLIEKGYDVQAVLFDYLTLMSPGKGASANSTNAQNIEKMTYEMQDFGVRTGFVTFVGAQAAKTNWDSVCQNNIHQVRKCTEAVIGESKGIYRAADIVLYQYIESNHKNNPYLTFKCGKYRDFSPTYNYNSFTAYKFTKYGIMDDIYGDDKSVIDIYEEDNIDDSINHSDTNIF